MSDISGKQRWLSRRTIMGATVGAALFFMVIGVIFWGGFNTAMEATNTLDFCISCHEMEENVYQEYTHTVHYSNRSGVRATCSDCHVPDPWVHKIVRKIQASNEVFHKLLGSIDTPEKFNEKRLYLAKRVWTTMKSTDSRECRNCHDFATMNPANQKPRAQKQHMNAMENGNTCIDCHKGIAHTKVHDKLTDAELEVLETPLAKHKRPIPPQWTALETAASDAAPTAAAPAAAEPPPAAAPAKTESSPAKTTGNSKIDWNKASSRVVTLFYPGQSSIEWVLTGRNHGGARPFKAGDRCFDCHDKETADMGKKIVTGEKVEPNPIPGKRGSIPVTVRAAHDKENLYLRFEWKDAAHVPVPGVAGGKMDAENPIKLGIMFATNDVEYADRAGCWGTCHEDLRTMPGAPDAKALGGHALAKRMDLKGGVTKYIAESRTEVELRNAPLGGWDKLKTDADLKAAMAAGQYMDLLRYKSGKGVSEDGHILAERVGSGGTGAEFTGQLNGDTWVVEMKRPLNAAKAGDVKMAMDQLYNFGFAIHDDYSDSRYHHVSLGYRLGFDNAGAEINAIGQ